MGIYFLNMREYFPIIYGNNSTNVHRDETIYLFLSPSQDINKQVVSRKGEKIKNKKALSVRLLRLYIMDMNFSTKVAKPPMI